MDDLNQTELSRLYFLVGTLITSPKSAQTVTEKLLKEIPTPCLLREIVILLSQEFGAAQIQVQKAKNRTEREEVIRSVSLCLSKCGPAGEVASRVVDSLLESAIERSAASQTSRLVENSK